MVCYEFFPEESINFGKMTVKIDFLDLLTAKNNFLTTGGLGQIPCTPYLPFSFFFCAIYIFDRVCIFGIGHIKESQKMKMGK